jgi:RHS repeat-associated protein
MTNGSLGPARAGRPAGGQAVGPAPGAGRPAGTRGGQAAPGAAPAGAPGPPQRPTVALPKGGGAVRGIGEKFSVNAANGTGSFTIPIPVSPGRAGFGPELTLSYDSGRGNGVFGFGWTLSLPAVTRKTDKGVPRYRDTAVPGARLPASSGPEDPSDPADPDDGLPDVFLLSDVEDLVPDLDDDHDDDPDGWRVDRFRPRIEGAFARIERWTADDGDMHWRSTSRDNVTTLYGVDDDSRVRDPRDPARVFSWLICRTFDDRGNAVVYEYVREDGAGVDTTRLSEWHREPADRTGAVHIKRIRYGNRVSTLVDPDPDDPGWMFDVVFDYGEHDDDDPHPDDAGDQEIRPDPFSVYRAGFEVRTYRRCRRILMFHQFPDDPAVGTDCLVRALELTYAPPWQVAAGAPATRAPAWSLLTLVTQRGYRRPDPGEPPDAGPYVFRTLPPLELGYALPEFHEEVHEADADGVAFLPAGLATPGVQLADLDAEGAPGVLHDQTGAWYYQANQGDGRLAPALAVARPTGATLTGRQLLDLAGDGQLDLVDLAGPTPGFNERVDGDWAPFRPFESLPPLDWASPSLRFTDLDGDGHADVLVTDRDAWTWYPSRGEAGFGPPRPAPAPDDQDGGPLLLFADATHSVQLADMSGDGLADLIRIRNGEICYWPNLGYGRFGRRVTMDASPWFAEPDEFDASLIRLADVDGSGITDLIYLGSGGPTVYLNEFGDGWRPPYRLRQFPRVDNRTQIITADLLGTGTTCLVWSSGLPADAGRPLRYVDLLGGRKPYLLQSLANNLGIETHVTYAPSTRFYLDDKAAGRPWVTRLPFPVHVVERVVTVDRINRNLFSTRYAYHHGYFDGPEREFRGFGMVEQFDTEELAVLSSSDDQPADNLDPATSVPPVVTRTWYHTGAYLAGRAVSRQYASEYASTAEPGLGAADRAALELPDSDLPSTLLGRDGTPVPYTPNARELREACRALKGSILREETYALDGSAAEDRPYAVREHAYTVELLQRRAGNRHAVCHARQRESAAFHYERRVYDLPQPGGGTAVLADPRVTHHVTLDTDYFGNELSAVDIGYGRRHDPAAPPVAPGAEAPPQPSPATRQALRRAQRTPLVTLTLTTWTEAIDRAGAHRTPLPYETRTYELLGAVGAAAPGARVVPLARRADLAARVAQASDGNHDLDPADVAGTGAAGGGTWRRLIEHSRVLYRADDLSGPLAPGTMGALALPWDGYQLALTPDLIDAAYQRPGQHLLPDPEAVLALPAGADPADRGGYVSGATGMALGVFPPGDPPDRWWRPKGTIAYSPSASHTTDQELEYAREHFFREHRFTDPFGGVDTVTYDDDDLLILQTSDELGNTITAGERAPNDVTITATALDYRVLAPSGVMDANRNRARVRFDALGLVVATAVMGKPEEALGDSLTGVRPDLPETVLLAHLADPLADPAAVLGQATSRLLYDLRAYVRTSGQAHPGPVVVYTMDRETHVSDEQGVPSRISHAFLYSDGFEREVQHKVQAEPGPLGDAGEDGEATGPVVDPRWAGTGWTVYDNKGRPVRQYEPFFSDTHRFEFARVAGVSSVLFYDPPGRVIATLHPNDSYDKVVFDPWTHASFDVNDTVLLDPADDEDVRAAMGRYLEVLDARPGGRTTWYDQRAGGALGPREAAAAAKAAVHAGTPIRAHADPLGRDVLTVADNRWVDADGSVRREAVASLIEIDIEGNHRALRDARDRTGVLQDFDLLGTRLRIRSADAGETCTVFAVDGQAIRSFDSRGHAVRLTYDVLRRPLRVWVATDGGPEVLRERTVYGEAHPEALARNLRTRYHLHLDGAGIVSSRRHDYRGNQLRSHRRLTDDPRALPDWTALDGVADDALIAALPAGMLAADRHVTSTDYDARNRPVRQTYFDAGDDDGPPPATADTVRVAYNEAGLLETVEARVRGEQAGGQPRWTPIVTGVAYDAKGRRVAIGHGNGARTTYAFDRLTLRLRRVKTTRRAADFPDDCPDPAAVPCGVQHVTYVYDPAGNITSVRDDAQQTVFFDGSVAEPAADYTYDALYQLIVATGREHQGQAGVPVPSSRTDQWRTALTPHPHDGSKLRPYRERYEYDLVGNLTGVVHRLPGGPTAADWTRTLTYTTTSALAGVAGVPAGETCNRLTTTAVGAGPAETYGHDPHGNVTSLPGLPLLEWDHHDRMHRVELPGGGHAYYLYDANGQRVRKLVERPDGSRQSERVYAGGRELYREYDATAANALSVQRQSVHVMDDQRRVALIEVRTFGTDPGAGRLVRWQYDNQLGSVTIELDEQARVITYEEYHPYGSTAYQGVRNVNETPKRYRYTGKERDAESGLAYHGARYYAPWLGRWLSPDPAGLTEGANLYAYCRGDPVNRHDPTGTVSWKTVAIIAAVVVVSIAVTVATAGVAGPVIAGALGSSALGTVATGVAVGALAGAAGGAAGEITRQVASGEAIERGGLDLKAVGVQALSGAAAGAVTGGLASLGALRSAGQAAGVARASARSVGTYARSVGKAAAQGAAGGGTGEAVRQVANGESFDGGKVLKAVGLGAAIGGGVHAASPVVRPLISPLSRVPGVRAVVRAPIKLGERIARKAYAPGSAQREAAEAYINSLNDPVRQQTASGKPFERRLGQHLDQVEGQTGLREQVTIRPYIDDKGTLADYSVRIDYLGRQNNQLRLSEAKVSSTGGFTKNQVKGLPLVEKYGGEIRGEQGGAAYPAGTVIPPTKVDVYRPGPGGPVQGSIQKGGID